MAYVNSTGLNPTTGEEYICGLIEAGTVSVDRAEEILGTYPEMAYALLFNNEKDIPLPQEEIGEAFKERLSKAREEIKRLRSRLNILENEKRSLEKSLIRLIVNLRGIQKELLLKAPS